MLTRRPITLVSERLVELPVVGDRVSAFGGSAAHQGCCSSREVRLFFFFFLF